MNNYVDYNKGFRREHTIGSEKGSGTERMFPSPAHLYCMLDSR